LRDQHRVGECFAKLRRKPAARCQVIEGLLFVKARHFHGPFDDGTAVGDFRSFGALRDGYDAPVDARRKAFVDRNFLLAGKLALLQRR
jgi:hypothetical protein